MYGFRAKPESNNMKSVIELCLYFFFTNHFQNCSLLIGEQNEAIEVDLEVTEGEAI